MVMICFNSTDIVKNTHTKQQQHNHTAQLQTHGFVPGSASPGGGGGHFHIEGDGDVPLDRV